MEHRKLVTTSQHVYLLHAIFRQPPTTAAATTQLQLQQLLNQWYQLPTRNLGSYGFFMGSEIKTMKSILKEEIRWGIFKVYRKALDSRLSLFGMLKDESLQ